jgi:hypothetical protein
VLDADHMDVIFGAEFLFGNGVIKIVIDVSALAPLTPHDAVSRGMDFPQHFLCSLLK